MCRECIEEFLIACLDCDDSVYENCAYLWSKDVKLLEAIKEILKEKLNVIAEIKEKESGDGKIYYLYVNNRKLLNKIIKKLKHPCKKLNRECNVSEGRNMAWKWLLENFPETSTGREIIHSHLNYSIS